MSLKDLSNAGTSNTMAIKGAACGIRPDLDEMSPDTAFDFSAAKDFLEENQTVTKETIKNVKDTKKLAK